MIHGDLHLRNLMICRNRPLLIDFARSDVAPIALDAGKFLIDAAVWLSDPEDLGSPPTVACIKDSKLGSAFSVFEPYLLRTDDIRLLEVAIRAYAYRYSSYRDVPEQTREKLKKIAGLEV